MSAITQCPECGTRFNISQQQLEAYHGMVRCGRCQAVFNAVENLYDDEPSPQLDLPIMRNEVPGQEPAETAAPPAEPAATAAEDATPAEAAWPENGTVPEPQLQAEEQVEEEKPAGELPVEEEFLAVPGKKKRPAWPWAVAASFLLLLLAAQAAYFFRVELAARLPGLKPALVSYCSLLDCQVMLPRDVDLMSIDSSDLEADPDHANVITLTATLRNHAAYAQAYPDLELTLNNTGDKPVARRTFHPAEYLRPGTDEKAGLGGRRELNVRLNLDTADLKPSGYRLLLFYPHKGTSD